MPNARTTPWRIWATRPTHQNSAWAQLLRHSGYDVIEFPLLSISPVDDDADIQAVKKHVLDFDQYHRVIFVSQNAVSSMFNWLDNYWPQLPTGITYYAVGKKTADDIRAHDIIVQSPDKTMNSEALLALDDLQHVEHEKILICRGKGGLPRIGEELAERGATVHYCELYKRELPADAHQQLDTILHQQHTLHQKQNDEGELPEGDIFVLFSGETLQNLHQVFNNSAFHSKFKPTDRPIIVPGERVGKLARTLGYKHVTVAENASQDCMLSTLHSLTSALAETSS